MHLTRAVVVALALNLLLTPSPASAECIALSLSNSKKAADLVLSGTVTSVKRLSGGRNIVDFKVDQVWKGKVRRKTRLYSFVDSIDTIRFESAKRYVVFAPQWGLLDFADQRRAAVDRGLNSCGWGREFDSVKSELHTLGQARRP